MEQRKSAKVIATIYYNYGNRKFRLGDKLSALTYYSHAINYSPNFAEAYNNRGTVKAKSGDLVGAIEDYNRAIEIDPDLTAAYNNRSRARFELGSKHSMSKSSSDHEKKNNSHFDINLFTTNQLIR